MKIKSLTAALFFALLSPAAAQFGEIGSGHVVGNPGATQADPTDASLSAMFDRAFCGTNGQAIVRTGGFWACGLPSVGTVAITIAPQHRITLASATAVMTSSQAAKTTVYVTPYGGNLIPIYDGSGWTAVAFAETSQATTDATKSPAAVAASSVYDIFCWIDGGTNRCTRGPAWTNTTTRSAGTALVSQNGILLNNASITNGPAASRGTYVGSICSDGSSQINYVFGAASSGGTAANFCVWNAYNRVSTPTTVTDNGAAYAYTTATIRQARASSGNQITFLIGLSDETVSAKYITNMHTTVNATTVPSIGVGLDSTAAFADAQNTGVTAGVTGVAGLILYATMSDSYEGYPGIGVHTLSANELGSGVNAATMDNNSNNRLMAVIRN